MYYMLLDTEPDRNRFQEIYEENYLKMYHIVFGIVKHQADAENAVHEAFLSLAENFGRYAQLTDGELSGLCISIVKNKGIDILRMRKHYSEAELETLVLYDERTEANPQKAQNAREESLLVRRALRQVSDVFRETLVLKYFFGLKNKEIANIQNVSTKVVEMRLYRGKQKLKEFLDGEELGTGR